MGEAALSISRSNFKNTARELKRLIGRAWEEPELQADLQRLPFGTEKHEKVRGFGTEKHEKVRGFDKKYTCSTQRFIADSYIRNRYSLYRI
jgi:molecular chaperone DnaK (HSP70)